MYIILTIETMALFSYFYSARPSGVFGPSCLKQQQDGQALQFVSTGLQDDPKIRTLAAVQQDAKAWNEAPEELKKDKEFMIRVMKANGGALKHIGEEMKGDRELCMAAVAGEFRAASTIAPGGNVCLWSTEPHRLKILFENEINIR